MPIFWASDCFLCGGASHAQVCAACQAALGRSDWACVRCAIRLPSAGTCGACLARSPRFDDAVAAFDYRFPLDRLVRRFKYSGDLAIGRWLAEVLAERAARELRPDVVVAPPSSRERLRERGFNPALEIAKVVARRVEAPCRIDALVRARISGPQPGLTADARRRNLEGAFACRVDLRGARVALVDDVLTTGATADAAAGVLKKAGAMWVSVWAVARTPDPHA